MNLEVKKIWINALRSGEFVQGKNALYNPAENTYCCLGVLCELASRKGLVNKNGSQYDSKIAILPRKVSAWAGLAMLSPEIDNISLIQHNDGCNTVPRKTFAEIADLIEGTPDTWEGS